MNLLRSENEDETTQLLGDSGRVAGRAASTFGRRFAFLGSALMMFWTVYVVILDIYMVTKYTPSERPRNAYMYFDPLNIEFWTVLAIGLVGMSQAYIFYDTEFKEDGRKCHCIAARVYSLIAGAVFVCTNGVIGMSMWYQDVQDKKVAAGIRKATATAVIILYMAVGVYVISTLAALYLVLTIPRIFCIPRKTEELEGSAGSAV